MGVHDAYGRQVLREAAGAAYCDSGPSCRVSLGPGFGATIDGTISPDVAVEIESRVPKQIRGALLDLLCHEYPKKLLVILPVHASNPSLTAAQCRHVLGRFLAPDYFRVIVFTGSGSQPALDEDALVVKQALVELHS